LHLNIRSEFARSYLEIQEELKFLSLGLVNKIETEKLNIDMFTKNIHDNRNEILNLEGLCNQAKITFQIFSLEFVEENYASNYRDISIRIKDVVQNSIKQTEFINCGKIVEFNDSFDL